MPLVSRELKVVYAGLAVGATTSYLIDGKFTLEKGYDTGVCSFDVVVASTDETTFASDCATLEAAYRTPRGRLIVTFGSATHADWDPAQNTGFNSVPSISKPGLMHDTGRSRRYHCSVTVQLPADLSGQAGRRSSSVNLITTDSGRRRLAVQGQYTVVPGGNASARTQYLNNYNAWVQGLLTGFTGTWEGPFEQQETVPDDTDKTISFSQMWEELIFNQSSGVLDDLTLRRQRLTITRGVEAPGDSPDHGSVARLETVVVDYSVAVDKAQTQDLKTVYQNKVLPFLLQTAKSVTSSAVAALVGQAPSYDLVENRLTVSLTVLVAGSSAILMATYRTDDSQDFGVDLVPAWSGDRMGKYAFVGPGRIQRTITQVWRQLGSNAHGLVASVQGGPGGGGSATTFGIGSLGAGGSGGFDFGSVTPGSNSPGTSGGASSGNGDAGLDVGVASNASSPFPDPDGGSLTSVTIGRSMTTMPLQLGRSGDPQIEVTDYVEVTRLEFYVPVSTPSSPNRTATGQDIGKGAPSAGPASNPPKVATGTGG